MDKKNLIFALVLVILIIIFGYVFLEGPSTTPCINFVDREMTELKLAIEDSVSRVSSSPLIFHPEGSCFSSSNKSGLIIYLEKMRDVCSQICGFAADECFIMKYSSEVNESLKRKCLNLPQYTTFEFGDNCVDQNLTSSGYSTIDPTIQGQISIGQYLIKNISSKESPYPRLCVWYKE